MAKAKKNTLKDLNSFLKQKPNTLVDVENAEDKTNDPTQTTPVQELSQAAIIKQIRTLAEKNQQSFRNTLLSIIQTALEEQKELNSSDIMLLNTVLYLDHSEKIHSKLEDSV